MRRMFRFLAAAILSVAVTAGQGFAQGASAWIGLLIQGTPSGEVVVVSIDPGSPAQRAGFQVGDTILSFNKTKAQAMLENPAQVGLKPGSTVKIKYRRSGEKEVTLKAGRRPAPLAFIQGVSPQRVAVRMQPERTASQRHTFTLTVPSPEMLLPGNVTIQQSLTIGGATMTSSNDDWTDALRAKADSGVLVLSVAPGSPAMSAGLRSGDLIVRAGDSKVASPAALFEAFHQSEGRDIVLDVERKGKRRKVTFRW